METVTDPCPKCGAEMMYDKHSDISLFGGAVWADLHSHGCPECGYIDDNYTSLE